MRRIQIVPLAVVVSLSTSACLTEKTKCPADHEKMQGLCVEVDDDPAAGLMDSGADPDDVDSDDVDSDDVDSGVDSDDVDSDDVDSDDSDSGTDGDASTTPSACYLDMDGDGVGAGAPVDCEASAQSGDASAGGSDGGAGPTLVTAAGDCDDANPARAPGLKESCDAVDNDCDEEVDEGAMNECGGVCIVPFEHRPGDDCENGLLGACARTGSYTCQGSNSVVCNAPTPTPSAELCGDTIDNDCDGSINEADASNAGSWYQDCDRDGYAASTEGALPGCTKPADQGSCTWTAVVPQPLTKTNWDCNDSSARYKPGAAFGVPPAGATSFDLDCNGTPEKENKIRDNGIERWLCPASDNGAYCSYWTSPSGTNLSTQPACSATASATYPADRVVCPGGVGFCEEVPFQGTQYCR